MKFTDLRAKEKLHDYSKKVEAAKNSYGQLINLMMDLEGNATNVVNLLLRSGYPTGLSPDLVKGLTPKETKKNDPKPRQLKYLSTATHTKDFSHDDVEKSNSIKNYRNYIQPKVIRLRDAPDYLGMDKNRFNTEVRPQVAEYRMGANGIAFDILDLNAWWEEYKARTGCSKSSNKGKKTWDNLKLEPKASTTKLMDPKQSVKPGKENESFFGSGESVKSKPKLGCTIKSKNENGISNADKAIAFCLQSVQRDI